MQYDKHFTTVRTHKQQIGRLYMMCHRDRQNGGWVRGSRSDLVPCIAWRCSACDSPPPAWTWSLGHGAGLPSSPRTEGPSGFAGPALGWTGSCSGPEVAPALDWVMEHISNSNGLIRVVSMCCLGLTLILQWLTNSDTKPTGQGPWTHGGGVECKLLRHLFCFFCFFKTVVLQKSGTSSIYSLDIDYLFLWVNSV